MGQRGGMQMGSVPAFTPVVKYLVISCVSVWIVLQLLVERFLSHPYITEYFGLIPAYVLKNFFVWQLVTYMFLHASNPMHVVFNMIMLWWLGSELEARWGSRFFLIYYLVSGIGAAFIYVFGIGLYAIATHSLTGLMSPVVGASGAIFGLLLAYGIIFGERITYLFMIFPMKAMYFVMILGAIEVVNLINSGVAGSEISSLSHLGGIVSGFVFLRSYTWFRQSKWRKQATKRGRGLRLVVDNERGPHRGGDDGGGNGGGSKNGGNSKDPKYWN